jgi:addiction module HigA family antidote
MASIKPTHPGEILREEFLKPMGISAYRLAKDIGVPINRITAITKEERAISPETALLLSHYFELSDELWSNLQSHYDMECAKDLLKGRLKNIPHYKISAESRL